jgi:DNA-directed RNA polymerase sigma subunit (sigma70/sigma32)
MKNELMYEKLAARIMAAKNREAVSVLVRDLSAKDIIILKEQYGVVLNADEEDQTRLEKFQVTKRKIEKIEKKALNKNNSPGSSK